MGESSSKSATNRPPSAHSNTDAITSRNSEPILQRQSLDNHSLKNHKPRKKTIKNERADFQLHRAASAGNFEVVSHLIKKGYNDF
jgi:DNA replication protein DnaC